MDLRLMTLRLRAPVVGGIAGVVLAVGTLTIDGALPAGWLLGWRPPSAGSRMLLGSLVGAIITVSALIFWVRGMFVQLSAGQMSSRVVRWYLADRYQGRVQIFLIAAFAYAATVTVSMGDRVPAPPLTTAVALVVSVAAMVIVIVTITDSARTTGLTEIMAEVADDTVAAVRATHPAAGQGACRTWPRPDLDGPAGPGLVRAPRTGWISRADDHALLAALAPGSTLRLHTRAGTFVLRGTPIGQVDGSDDEAAAVAAAIGIGRTRTVANDVELGLRELVDTALQALAVGSDDATSAYEAINYLTAIVHEILLRDLPDDDVTDPQGRRVLRLAELSYAEYVAAAFDQIRQSGAGWPAIAVLLNALRMLADAVADAGLTDRLPPLQRQIELVLEHVADTDAHPSDIAQARRSLQEPPARR